MAYAKERRLLDEIRGELACGRKVQVYYDGPRVRLVAWKAGGAVYWVSNTLLQRLSLAEMLAVVRSARPL